MRGSDGCDIVCVCYWSYIRHLSNWLHILSIRLIVSVGSIVIGTGTDEGRGSCVSVIAVGVAPGGVCV